LFEPNIIATDFKIKNIKKLKKIKIVKHKHI